MSDLLKELVERLASENIYVARGLAREDDSIDVHEDDFDRTEDDDSYPEDR